MNKLCTRDHPNKTPQVWLFISLLIMNGCQNDEPPKPIESNSNLAIAVKPPLQHKITHPDTHSTFNYVERAHRNPFMPFKESVALNPNNPQTTAKKPAPDTNRHKEALESYPINTLKMLGHIEYKHEIWALIKTDDALVHRVKVGNYMGFNYGKITAISAKTINISESLLDQAGLWHEQLTLINLTQ